VVLDPVMVAESGARLLEPAARVALVEFLPRATVVTPNIAEAYALLETAGASSGESVEELARALHRLGPRFVVVTGGHGDGVDVFFDGRQIERIGGERYPGGATHGSGCTHSAALAAHLALGLEPLEAARAAKRIASEAVRDGLRDIGAGPGPVDVFGLSGDSPEDRPAAAPE
jgi:hydroxymethylpyrimidine/phosphomethylpyrimidine kinase